MKVKQNFRTADLAQAAGINVQTVRKYEEWGFLPDIERLPNGYRHYTAHDLKILLLSRTLIRGYGWAPAQEIMQYLHRQEIETVLTLVDKRHAESHRIRAEVEQTRIALQAVVNNVAKAKEESRLKPESDLLKVGEAAAQVGVKASAIHFWEAQGLLKPRRGESGYRLYDASEMLKLRVIVLLREAGYNIALIKSAIAELAAGRAARALEAVETRLANLSINRRNCTAATAALWSYINESD